MSSNVLLHNLIIALSFVIGPFAVVHMDYEPSHFYEYEGIENDIRQ